MQGRRYRAVLFFLFISSLCAAGGWQPSGPGPQSHFDSSKLPGGGKEGPLVPGFEVWSGGAHPAGLYYLEVSPYLYILDDQGIPVFVKEVPGGVRNFALQPEGSMSYYHIGLDAFLNMDDSYQVTDTLRVGEGQSTDFHFFSLQANGYALLLGNEYRVMDLSSLVPGGQQNATVSGAVIRELDGEGQVLFEWNSFDHIPLLESDPCLVDLTASSIDAVHVNSVEVLPGGDLLVSARNLSQVFRLSRQSGERLWRLGGVGNDFSMQGNGTWFSAQHAATMPQAGEVLLLDNGYCHDPKQSRAVRYTLDENGFSVSETGEYRPGSPVFAPVMGNVREYTDGSLVIGWGKNDRELMFTEFYQGVRVLEMDFGASQGAWSYAVTKGPLIHRILEPEQDSLDFQEVEPGLSGRLYLSFHNLTDRELLLTGVHCAQQAFQADTLFPLSLEGNATVRIPILFTPLDIGDYASRFTLFANDSPGGEWIQVGAQVELSGQASVAGGAPVLSSRAGDLHLYPNPAGNMLHIRSGDQLAWLRISRADGTIVYLSRPSAGPEVLVPTTGWKPGLYFLEAVEKSGGYSVTRFLKGPGNHLP